MDTGDAGEAGFRALTAIGDLEGCSVLDVGCGFDDLYKYLCRNGIDVDYTGIDLSPDFVEIARQRHPDATFIAADFEGAKLDRRYDWAFESGVFNYKVSGHEVFVGNMVRKMFRSAVKGIAIDFLNHRGGFFSVGLYHPRPADIYAFCTKLSRRVTLRCDYKPTEFCVYVYRGMMRKAPGTSTVARRKPSGTWPAGGGRTSADAGSSRRLFSCTPTSLYMNREIFTRPTEEQ
jgi:SAM-dependent methyltransferase